MTQYRRKATIRLPGYDYSQDGYYFVTSCVQDKQCHFGHVIDDEMVLNSFGQIAQDQWDWLLNQYPYIASHAFVVMPNHIHAVLEINRGLLEMGDDGQRDGQRNVVGTGRDLSLHRNHNDSPTDQPIKIKPLDQLLGAYKTTTSKLIHLAGLPEFKWQRSYHDHIIRAEDSYERIVAYIHSNPARWPEDKFYHS